MKYLKNEIFSHFIKLKIKLIRNKIEMLFFVNHTKQQYIYGSDEKKDTLAYAFEKYNWSYNDDIGAIQDVYEFIYYENLSPQCFRHL